MVHGKVKPWTNIHGVCEGRIGRTFGREGWGGCFVHLGVGSRWVITVQKIISMVHGRSSEGRSASVVCGRAGWALGGGTDGLGVLTGGRWTDRVFEGMDGLGVCLGRIWVGCGMLREEACRQLGGRDVSAFG